jgi:biotin carboxylase
MMTSDGPCLVEMNCRAHGGDGNWRPLSVFITGYSQVEATADCYVDPKAFARIPDKPPSPFKASGQEVMFVSFSKGKVKSTPGYEVIQKLPSFVSYETGIKPGSEVDYTVDLFTGIGGVILMHSDEDVLQKDVEFIRYLEKINGFFVYENQMENLKRPRGESIVLSSVGGAKGAGHRRVFSSDGPNLIRHMSNDRPELRGPLMKRMTTVDSSKECVVLVDPYSTGCLVAEETMKRGYKVIALWTRGFSLEMRKHVPLSVGHLAYMDEVEEDENGDLQETSNRVYKAAGVLQVVAIICGGEAGIDLTDALSEKLNLRTNGTHIPCKRDKMVQQELIRKRGLRSVRGASGRKFQEVEPFLLREKYPVVLKPTESAGSDGVKLCYNIDEAKEHFEALMQSQMVNGGQCPAVVCQEFLRGKEYVVDMVSREGKHRCMMVWVYDKRVANGSAFVYFGCIPVDSESPEAKILISYTKRVLDALEVRNGPSHNEIMMMNDGPCLVEANVRCHGGDGNWRSLCRELCGGYSQVESAVDSFLDAKAFAITPEKPASPFKAAGQEVILVSYSRGKVKATPGFDAIMKLQSYVYLETGVRPGVEVDYTTDLFTGIGSVILMHKDADVVKKDIEFIRDLEKTNMMFELEPSQVLFKSPSANALGDA